VNRVVDDSLAVDIDFHLGQAIGLDAIVGGQIGGADYASNCHRLLLSVDLHHLRPLEQEVAIGKLASDTRGQGGIQGGTTRGGSLAVQSGRTGLIEHVG
jgi:hypothetical protein